MSLKTSMPFDIFNFMRPSSSPSSMKQDRSSAHLPPACQVEAISIMEAPSTPKGSKPRRFINTQESPTSGEGDASIASLSPSQLRHSLSEEGVKHSRESSYSQSTSRLDAPHTRSSRPPNSSVSSRRRQASPQRRKNKTTGSSFRYKKSNSEQASLQTEATESLSNSTSSFSSMTSHLTSKSTNSHERMNSISLQTIQDHKAGIAEMRPTRRKIRWNVDGEINEPEVRSCRSPSTRKSRVSGLNIDDLDVQPGARKTQRPVAEDNPGSESLIQNIRNLEDKIKDTFDAMFQIENETKENEEQAKELRSQIKVLRRQIDDLPDSVSRTQSLRQAKSQMHKAIEGLRDKIKSTDEQVTVLISQKHMTDGITNSSHGQHQHRHESSRRGGALEEDRPRRRVARRSSLGTPTTSSLASSTSGDSRGSCKPSRSGTTRSAFARERSERNMRSTQPQQLPQRSRRQSVSFAATPAAA